ncbi:Methionine aminopeptidase 2 [Baekduia alba]|uniref:type I methionyl aminopeptidase n=1 Tax=Baekduia alba TaxID=2997333 RepID=UPI00233FDA6C|nr:type I methionyl aminopeptidase [Baekduia alba]WCB94703.1 Methionine aminopeptidase 2 [Baekduia alba]
MSTDTPEQLEGMKAAGRVVAQTIRELRKLVRPGVTTLELDQAAGRVFAAHGAQSGPQLDYNFPGVICISVNDEAVHGIPSGRRLRDGDLVKLDVTAELNGFYADACRTVAVGKVKPSAVKLIGAAESGLKRGLAVATAGATVNDIGVAVQHEIEKRGFSVCATLTGHGIGRRIHEEPTVFSVGMPGPSPTLTEGLVITIEPIIAAGEGDVVEDGEWIVRTADGSLSAHAEHTIVITDGAPLVLTA